MPEIANERTNVRLTSLSHGGGCGCKLAPSVLEQIIARSGAPRLIPPQLLVGIETSDDAAVYQISDDQAIVATTDFFMPIVDDPFDFGAIAATNAISDVYAMGGRPLFALALVAMPIDKLPLDTIRRILDGGESVCRRAGVPVAGGHSVDSVEPIYGLVAIGLVDPQHVKRNAAAAVGDKIILGKALGVGVYGAAFKKQQMTDTQYQEMIASTTQLNTPGIATGSTRGRSCPDRRDGLRSPGAPDGSMPRVWRPRHGALERNTAVQRRAATGSRGTRHRGVDTKLEKLRRPGRSHHARSGRAGAADRSADERRPAGRLRA